MLASLFFAMLLGVLLARTASLAAGIPAEPTPVSTETEAVVLLELDGEPVADSFLITEKSGETYLPVCALAEALSLAITCLDQRAFGFVPDEARPFLIDLAAGHAICGRDVFFIRGEAFMRQGELLASTAALSRWLPIDFHLRPETSTLQMKAREALPLQGFRQRQRFVLPRHEAAPKQHADFTPARRALSVPTLDLAAQIQTTKHRSELRSVIRNSLDMSGDLLYMTGEAHLLAEDDALKRLDVTLSRRSTEGFGIGPVPLTHFAAGATQAPYVDGIGASTKPMYGVYLSNRPLRGGAGFLSHDMHGHLPHGWDAELFHNGTQVAYQPPTEEGMYHFVNLRVYYGINSFRVVLHGPFGERRESEEVFIMDATTPKGEFLYTFSAGLETGWTNKEKLDRLDRDSNTTLTSDFGITKSLTGSLLMVGHNDYDGGYREYLGLGVRTAFRYTLLSAELIQAFSQQKGGAGQLLTVRSSSRNVFGLNLEVVQRFFRDYYSPQFYYRSDPLRTWTSVKGNSSFTLFDRVRTPYSIELGFNTRSSGELEALSLWRVSAGWNGWNAAMETEISYLQRKTQAKGVLQVSSMLRDISIRGQAGFIYAPDTALSTVNLSVDKDLGRGFQLNTSVSHDPGNDLLGLRLGVSKRMGRLGYSLAANGSSDGLYGFDLGVRSSIAADTSARQVIISAEPLSPYGMVAVFARGAEPANAGKPLHGIGFLLNGRRAGTISGSSGGAVIAFLHPDVPVDVTVDMATVEDPFMVPLQEGCRVTPRAGVVSICNFTMTAGGEVDGMVLVRLRQGGEVPIKGVRVDLVGAVDGKSRLEASARSEESGYYLFKTVRPGSYQVVIPADEVARLRVSGVQPLEITMPVGGDMVSGLDFILEPAASVSGRIIGEPGFATDQD